VLWTLDHITGLKGRMFDFVLHSSASGGHGLGFSVAGSPGCSILKCAGFRYGTPGDVIGSHSPISFHTRLPLFNTDANVLASDVTGYFGFRTNVWWLSDAIYGWAKYTLYGGGSSGLFSIDHWYYNDTPGASIVVGDKGTPTAVPEPLTVLGAALEVPIFIGLRQLKRRKLKANSIVSVKRKEKIHPLALLGMGAAGVLKWRAQKDKDAA